MTAAQRRALRAGLRPCSLLRPSKWLWNEGQSLGATCMSFFDKQTRRQIADRCLGDHLVSDTVAPFALAERGH